MVPAGTSTMSTPVLPEISRENSAPAREATRAPTGSPTTAVAAPPSKANVPAPIAPVITDENNPSGGAPTDHATPAPIAGPISSWADLPMTTRRCTERASPACLRIRPIISDEKSPSAMPLDTLTR
ncbi:MAG: hypothetical protein BWY99_02762 [Synergistetes bacterium ADurb.BinA166]|nr:MAG: hypothetical protein BWY99_02762 [Synergistetes bacterium ADurb.BinA166]